MVAQHHIIGQKTGQSVVTNPAMLIIAIVVFAVIIFLVFELFYGVKIGRAICNYTGGTLLRITGYSGILSGVSQAGVQAACNMLFF